MTFIGGLPLGSRRPYRVLSTERRFGLTSDRPAIRFTDSAGEDERRQYYREYPFAWFGILCQAPNSAPELIYKNSERGFAQVRQRTETMQRMYFQCVSTRIIRWRRGSSPPYAVPNTAGEPSLRRWVPRVCHAGCAGL
jgi:hypothetical protein